MDTGRMDALLAMMKPEEIRDALWYVDVCERFEDMEPAEADERRRRILARQQFLGLGDTPAD